MHQHLSSIVEEGEVNEVALKLFYHHETAYCITKQYHFATLYYQSLGALQHSLFSLEISNFTLVFSSTSLFISTLYSLGLSLYNFKAAVLTFV